MRWFRGPDLEQVRKEDREPYGSGRGFWKPLLADLDRFREISRLAPELRDGGEGVFLEMSLEDAMRTYIVYDHLPDGGFGVMDGGYWDTYDLPAIVEAIRVRIACNGLAGGVLGDFPTTVRFR